MEKLISIAKFLRDVFYKQPGEEREITDKRFNLNKKIDLRVTEGEYQIIQKMCELHKISISEYFRSLNMTYTNKFIVESDAENQYYDMLDKKNKFKKAS